MNRRPSRRGARVGEAASGEHPFFRAMVLMGSSLAVGCGGAVKDQEHGTIGDGSGGAGAVAASGGASSSGASSGGASFSPAAGGATSRGGANQAGGAPSTGGTSQSSGGAPPGSGGAIVLGSGGITAILEPDAGVAPCAPAQWSCDTDTVYCSGGDEGYFMPNAPCGCDPTRPTSAEACPAGTKFLCQAFTIDAAGKRLSSPLAFGCACVPPAPDCEEACAAAHGSAPRPSACLADAADNYLCGCAVILLR